MSARNTVVLRTCFEARAGGFEDRFQVLHHALGLLGDAAFYYLAGGGVERDLAAEVGDAVVDDRLRVGADRFGCFVGVNCVLHHFFNVPTRSRGAGDVLFGEEAVELAGDAAYRGRVPEAGGAHFDRACAGNEEFGGVFSGGDASQADHWDFYGACMLRGPCVGRSV